ncbi:MAG: acyl-CoA synthetase [Burkholderiales bacterium]
MSMQWLEARERSNAAGIRLLLWIALGLGRPAGRILLYPICLYFLLFSGRARAASRKYLAKALGRKPSIVDSYRHYLSFAVVALDRMFLLRDRTRHFDIRIQGEDVLRRELARGQSVFLLGAHLGSFEVLRAKGRELNIRVSLAMFEQTGRNFNAIARAINPELEAAVIRLGTPESMIRLVERLESGDWVGMLGDRSLSEAGQVRVPFFGEEAAFPTAPFRIAAMLGRPVVLMVGLYRGGNRYDLCFEQLVEFPYLERATRDKTMREWAQRYAQRLEHYCREAPYNWFNFYDFWARAKNP